MPGNIRQPIVVTVGHIDHGKTSILDRIRGTATQAAESGGITQSIGASIIPLSTLKTICGDLISQLNLHLTIPGLLFIDTPGHEAFASLRKRGGSIADMALLVVDINEGFKPQTKEAVEILRQYKTPFVVAANKIDRIPGWNSRPGRILESISSQAENVRLEMEKRLYTVVAQLYESGFEADRFDKVTDHTKQITVIPCSALTGEGIPELLMVLAGLAQRYLDKQLRYSKGPGKGSILEVKEVQGMGVTIDVILYDGTLNRDDTIVIGAADKPVVTKIRALLVPAPLADMREKRTKFTTVDSVTAATGVKISAPGMEQVVAGMPIMAASQDNLNKIKAEVMAEVGEVLIDTEQSGVVIKAESIGSLEALTWMLRQRKIPVRKASLGTIAKKDFADAESSCAEDRLYSVILAFNVGIHPGAKEVHEKGTVKVISGNIIYQIIDEYGAWVKEEKLRIEACKLQGLVSPCKLRIIPGYVFRQSGPAIVGVEILAGSLRSGSSLTKDEEPLTTVREIQHEKKSISCAEAGKKVAVSLDRVAVGRQINEGDLLYSYIDEQQFRALKECKHLLKEDALGVLKEIAAKRREKNPVWGI